MIKVKVTHTRCTWFKVNASDIECTQVSSKSNNVYLIIGINKWLSYRMQPEKETVVAVAVAENLNTQVKYKYLKIVPSLPTYIKQMFMIFLKTNNKMMAPKCVCSILRYHLCLLNLSLQTLIRQMEVFFRVGPIWYRLRLHTVSILLPYFCMHCRLHAK